MNGSNISRREFIGSLGTLSGGLLLSGCLRAEEASMGEAPRFSFLVVADPHLREDREGEPTGVEKFQRVLEKVPGMSRQPDFMLLLGDIHPEKLEPLLPHIGLPVHPIHGNQESKEHRQQLRAMFPGDFGAQDFFTFTHKGSHFIALCTALVGDHVGHFESEDITPAVGQIEWLEAELKKATGSEHCFVYGHNPPEPNNQPHPMCLGSREAHYFHELLKTYPPTACFFGHRHARIRYETHGVPIFGVRSCNWNVGDEPIGFLEVRVGPQKIQGEFIETL